MWGAYTRRDGLFACHVTHALGGAHLKSSDEARWRRLERSLVRPLRSLRDVCPAVHPSHLQWKPDEDKDRDSDARSKNKPWTPTTPPFARRAGICGGKNAANAIKPWRRFFCKPFVPYRDPPRDEWIDLRSATFMTLRRTLLSLLQHVSLR